MILVRRAYPIQIAVNGIHLSRVVIDPHYEIKHRSSVNDEVILELVGQLDQESVFPDSSDDKGFRYFTSDLWTRGKYYRLVWLLPPSGDYLGVVNAYRRRYGRNG